MKADNRPWLFLKIFIWPTMLMLPAVASADARTNQLKRCLQDLGGIEWMRCEHKNAHPVALRGFGIQSFLFEYSSKGRKPILAANLRQPLARVKRQRAMVNWHFPIAVTSWPS